MKVLSQALVVGLIGSIAGAGLAQTDNMDPATMTCADFMALSQEDQTAAMDAMTAADAMAPGEAATDDMAADQMAADDMASDDMAADETATDEMASDDMAAEDTMMSEQMTAMMAACEGAPDMMARDAMTSAMEN